jgi:histidyl-tRNA synthetase
VSETIDAVRGMRDVLPNEQRAFAHVRARLENLVAGHGYRPLDLPIVEQRALYLRKLGEELVGKVYEFSYGGRDLALRPEWTASVLRAYVAHMHDQPLPLRLSYCGPVFRYERPQRLTYRQFTQLGVELVGAPAPRADAEVLALACAGLDALGVADYTVRVGHIGLVRALLGSLGLTERTQSILMWSLERLRDEGVEAVRAHLQQTSEGEVVDAALLEGLDDQQAAALLQQVLGAMNMSLGTGSRSPDAIVSRLLRKLRRTDPQPKVDRALDLLSRLCAIGGAPAEALPRVAALLAEQGLPSAALDDLRAILALLDAHGRQQGRLTLDFGLGRGLHYYTGMIFEIDGPDGLQLCGGGRYDDLVTALGGRNAIPAVGCAYGLERVVAAATVAAPAPRPDVLVIAIGDDDYPYALSVAGRLREQGYAATLDVRGRSVAAALRDADRRGVAAAAIVGPDERARGTVVWRNLADRTEQPLRLDDLPSC